MSSIATFPNFLCPQEKTQGNSKSSEIKYKLEFGGLKKMDPF